jgi:metacaspase-1
MAKGFSIHIGLNAIDPEHYHGFDGQLNACENDAKSMAEIARLKGFTRIEILLTEQAIRQKFLNLMNQYANLLEEGDIFLLTFSGHGGQLPDENNDEDDGMDETWSLFDGQIVDDELQNLYCLFKKNVRILVFSDSCHSGTIAKSIAFRTLVASLPQEVKPIFKDLPLDICMKTFSDNKDFYEPILKSKKKAKKALKASLMSFSACQDNQKARDGFINSLFTEKLLKVWAKNSFDGNYLKFQKAIVRNMSQTPDQSPNFFVIGKENKLFNNQNPFSV